MRLFRRSVLALGLLPLASTILVLNDARAQTAWTATAVDPTAFPKEIVPETRRRAPGGFPHALMARGAKTGDVGAAWYAGRTKRYGHGILGDAIEGSILRVATNSGRYLKLTLPETEVFEDRYPRLADLDGDGTVEIVTIRASVSEGAAVTVYGVEDEKLVMRATTPFIGRANRWLNIAGIARFRGGRGREIAYVQTPHIGGTLFFHAFEKGKLVRVGEISGFSNHVIGATEMRLSAIADIDGDGAPELAVPSADRLQLRIVGFKQGTLAERGLAQLPSAIDKAIAVQGKGPATRFIVGLRNGRVFSVSR